MSFISLVGSIGPLELTIRLALKSTISSFQPMVLLDKCQCISFHLWEVLEPCLCILLFIVGMALKSEISLLQLFVPMLWKIMNAIFTLKCMVSVHDDVCD